MKNLAKSFSAMAFIVGSICLFSACEQSKGDDNKAANSAVNPDVTGVWIVTDETGNQFDITLNKDGTATSTWKVLDRGKWKLVSQKKAHIQWNNGANEFIIVDERGGAERQTFAPGKPTEGKPQEITIIKKKK